MWECIHDRRMSCRLQGCLQSRPSLRKALYQHLQQSLDRHLAKGSSQSVHQRLFDWHPSTCAEACVNAEASKASDDTHDPLCTAVMPLLVSALATYAATTAHVICSYARPLLQQRRVVVHWAGASIGEVDGLPCVEAFLLHQLPACKVRGHVRHVAADNAS
jgi:hypothetical protein